MPPGVTFDAEAHVDFMDRHDAIHVLHVAVTFLALDARRDMRPMGEAHEVRQGVHAVPSHLEGGLRIVGPRTRHRLDTAHQPRAMTSDASRDRRDTGTLGPARILVAILAGNLVDARVNPMAEGNRLLNIGARRPRTLGKSQRAESEDQQDNRERKQGPVHVARRTPITLRLRPIRCPFAGPRIGLYKVLVCYVEEPDSWFIGRGTPLSISASAERLPENRGFKLSNIAVVDDQAILID